MIIFKTVPCGNVNFPHGKSLERAEMNPFPHGNNSGTCFYSTPKLDTGYNQCLNIIGGV